MNENRNRCQSVGFVGMGDHQCRLPEGHGGRFHKAESRSMICWGNENR